jgi:lipopolysaccharide export system protein LptA
MTGEQIKTGLAALALLVAVTAGPVAAQEKGALEVEASEMEILDAENKTIFRGDVDALRDGDRIRSEVMVVTYVDVKQADGTTKSEADVMEATGGVTITTGEQVITGAKALMLLREDKLTVTGNVKLVQGKTVLRGEKLMVDLNTKKTVMTGGRVKGSFVPR